MVTAVGEYHYSRDTEDDTLKTQRKPRSRRSSTYSRPTRPSSSVEAPQPLVLSGRTNPFQHQMFDFGIDGYVDDTWPGGLTGLGERHRAAGTDRDRPRHHPNPPWLMAVLAEDYVARRHDPRLHLVRPPLRPPDIQSQMRAIVNGS